MMARPLSSSRGLLDVGPLQGPSAGRGVGSYARGLLGGLIAEGFDSRLTLLLDAGLAEPSLPPGRYQLAGSRRRYHGQLAGYEEAVALRADLERIRPDLYHAIDLRLPGRSPCPVAVTVHDLIPWAWGGPRMRGERLRYWLGKRLLKRADMAIAVSQATAADAARFAGVDPSRIRVVPEAADDVFRPRPGAPERVKQHWGVEAGYLLFVGALDARKDPAALIRALAAARMIRPRLERVAAGDPGRQAPPSMPGATLLGRVSDEELADLYAGAGGFVFPSRYEGAGLSDLEHSGGHRRCRNARRRWRRRGVGPRRGGNDRRSRALAARRPRAGESVQLAQGGEADDRGVRVAAQRELITRIRQSIAGFGSTTSPHPRATRVNRKVLTGTVGVAFWRSDPEARAATTIRTARAHSRAVHCGRSAPGGSRSLAPGGGKLAPARSSHLRVGGLVRDSCPEARSGPTPNARLRGLFGYNGGLAARP